MKLKVNFKRFWTLSKSRKGFTLVELIVVIAILAILAGVAIPVYNGYIKKAQTAADEQLLDTINTAFAAACISNGVNHVEAAGTALYVNANGTIASGDDANGYTYRFGLKGANVVANETDIVDTFAMFFANNEKSAFKGEEYVKGLVLNAEGQFVPGDVVMSQLKTYLANSSYKDLVAITGQVDGLVGSLKDYITNDTSWAGGGYGAYLTELGIDASTEPTKAANAAILYLAKTASGMTQENVNNVSDIVNQFMVDLYSGENPSQTDVINKLTAETGSQLASYAAIYAVAEGIALQQGPDSDAYNALVGADLSNPVDIFNSVGAMLGSINTEAEDKVMVDYFVNNGQTSKDIEAFYGALGAVSANEEQLKGELGTENLFTEGTTIKELLDKLNG